MRWVSGDENTNPTLSFLKEQIKQNSSHAEEDGGINNHKTKK